MQKKTYGELLRPFMDPSVSEQEAQKRFDFFVGYIMEDLEDEMEDAVWRARSDIAYYANSYFPKESGDKQRVLELYAIRDYRSTVAPPAPDPEPFQRFAYILAND